MSELVPRDEGWTRVSGKECVARACRDMHIWGSGGVAFSVVGAAWAVFRWALVNWSMEGLWPSLQHLLEGTLLAGVAWFLVLLLTARGRILAERKESRRVEERENTYRARLASIDTKADILIEQTGNLDRAIRKEDRDRLPDLKFNIDQPTLGQVDRTDAIFVWVRLRNLGFKTTLFDWTASITLTTQDPGEAEPKTLIETGTICRTREGIVASHNVSHLSADDFLLQKLSASNGIDRGSAFEGWLAFTGFSCPILQIFGEMTITCCDAFGVTYTLMAFQRPVPVQQASPYTEGILDSLRESLERVRYEHETKHRVLIDTANILSIPAEDQSRLTIPCLELMPGSNDSAGIHVEFPIEGLRALLAQNEHLTVGPPNYFVRVRIVNESPEPLYNTLCSFAFAFSRQEGSYATGSSKPGDEATVLPFVMPCNRLAPGEDYVFYITNRHKGPAQWYVTADFPAITAKDRDGAELHLQVDSKQQFFGALCPWNKANVVDSEPTALVTEALSFRMELNRVVAGMASGPKSRWFIRVKIANTGLSTVIHNFSVQIVLGGVVHDGILATALAAQGMWHQLTGDSIPVPLIVLSNDFSTVIEPRELLDAWLVFNIPGQMFGIGQAPSDLDDVELRIRFQDYRGRDGRWIASVTLDEEGVESHARIGGDPPQVLVGVSYVYMQLPMSVQRDI